MRAITLPVFGIKLKISGSSGTIVSNLHESDNDWRVDEMLHAIESLVLAHACAGVDVENPAYLEGIETAVDAICNQE